MEGGDTIVTAGLGSPEGASPALLLAPKEGTFGDQDGDSAMFMVHTPCSLSPWDSSATTGDKPPVPTRCFDPTHPGGNTDLGTKLPPGVAHPRPTCPPATFLTCPAPGGTWGKVQGGGGDKVWGVPMAPRGAAACRVPVPCQKGGTGAGTRGWGHWGPHTSTVGTFCWDCGDTMGTLGTPRGHWGHHGDILHWDLVLGTLGTLRAAVGMQCGAVRDHTHTLGVSLGTFWGHFGVWCRGPCGDVTSRAALLGDGGAGALTSRPDGRPPARQHGGGRAGGRPRPALRW